MKKLSQHEMQNELIAITSQLLAESGEQYKREVRLDDSLQRHLGIDSLGRAELFQRIEKAFQVTLPDRLLAEADTLLDIMRALTHIEPGKEMPAQSVVTSHGEQSRISPLKTKTLLEVLLLYGERSPKKPHIYFQNEEGGSDIITYGQLLEFSLRVAEGLRERGLQAGETVAIMQPTHPGFFYTFFGTLLAGGIPVPIYPPFRMHMLEAYAKTEARILSNAEVRILVTFEQAEKLSLLLKTFVPSLKHVTTVTDLLQPNPLKTIYTAEPESFAFIQYTSGSTSDPKGVLLTHHNLLSNIRAYGKAINVKPDDIAVSWLPLYHDMGLIGMWLGSLYFGIPLVLMTPFTFLTRPERWLWAMHYHRGTLSGAPNFAYELCIRKIEPALLEGLDLSAWRVAANGAEKVYPRTLEQFATKFAPYGFKRSALLPVYGLAESTVALTIPPLAREFRIDYVEREAFEKKLAAVSSEEKNALEFASCGLPIEGHEVRIVNQEGEVLPERQVGRLQFRGPSSMQGYYNNSTATSAIYHQGWWDSGDLAYLAQGEVFITGRRKDLIIKAGRNIYPAEIEELVGNIAHVRQGCVTAFSVTNTQKTSEQLIIVAETREKTPAVHKEIIAAIQEKIISTMDVMPDEIILVEPYTVPKTSSGKLQRTACKAMYVEGRLKKKLTPPWVQVAKLGATSFRYKITSAIKNFSYFIYTTYVAFLLLLSVLPLWLTVLFASREKTIKTCSTWAKYLLSAAGCSVEVIGREKLQQSSPIIFAANHASYIDSIVLLTLLPTTTRFVGKKELFSVPLLRSLMRKLDYIAVDRMDFSKGLEDAKRIEDELKMNPILIFPEGTFSYASGLRPFRLGAFKIAANTETPICPIALKGTRNILRGDEKLIRPGKITVTVCDLIKPTGIEWQDVTHLRDAVRAEVVKHCGEPSLDFIAAQTVAAKPTKD
ncbi:MAG: AMP-binding protein [Gammaproteobacteria bacterium]|nr:AMP-binding protein [Gammaproteobacteria bacterium]